MEKQKLDAIKRDAAHLKQASEADEAIAARRELAYQACDAIAEKLPSREVVLRFRRRHAGFVRGYFVTDNHQLGLLYSHRLIEEGGHDAVIGHAIKHILHAHFAEYHHLNHEESAEK